MAIIRKRLILFSSILLLVLAMSLFTVQLSYGASEENTAGSTMKEPEAISLMASNAWKKNSNGTFNDGNGKVLKGAVAKGLDISKWQDSVNWKKVKSSDIDFIILRCGYRTNNGKEVRTDEKWKSYVAACEKYGIPYGVYFYSTAANDKEVDEEIAKVKALLKGHHPTYPVYYDMEDPNRLKKAGKTFINKAGLKFCREITDAGYTAGIYASKSWWTTYLTDSQFGNYERWVAHWRNSKSDYKKSFGMWQCTSSYHSAGIGSSSTRVDLNFAFKSFGNFVPGYWDTDEDGKDIFMTYPQVEEVIVDDEGIEETQLVYDIDHPELMQSSFITLDGSTYYLDEKGHKVTGIYDYDGKKYVFDTTGVLKKSAWVFIGSRYYYAKADGTAYVNTYQKVGDYSYFFDETGARVVNSKVRLGNKEYKLSNLNGRAILNQSTVKTKVKYRKGPGTKYAKKGYLAKGSTVEVIRVQGSWSMLSDGYWTMTKYLTKTISYPLVIENNPVEE